MNRLHLLLSTLVLLAPLGAQAATTTKSCSPTEKPGYVMSKIISNSSACSGNSQYTFTLLAGETQLNSCVSTPPSGWINTKQSSYYGTGLCGTTNGPTKKTWQITNSSGQIKLKSCLRTLPAGWVITRQISYTGSGDCGASAGSPVLQYEVQSSAGLSKLSVCSSSTLPSGWQVSATSSNSNCGTGSGTQWQILNNTTLSRTPLYRYTKKNGDSLYTVQRNDSGMAAYGYRYDAITAYSPKGSYFGTTPLHRYFNATTADSLYTITRDDTAQNKAGYAYSGVAAYVYSAQVSKSVPLHRYWNPTNKHHLYTTQYFTNGAYGFQYEKIEGYLYTAP